jgi:excisionase family DNA binding protein
VSNRKREESPRATGGEYIGVNEVAAMVGLSPGTVTNWRSRGLLPAAAVLGRSVRWKKADIVAWVEAQITVDAKRLETIRNRSAGEGLGA